jgi:hypothetical protein
VSLTEVFSTSVVSRRAETADHPGPEVTAELHRCAAACRSYVETLPTASLPPGDPAVALAASCAEICQMTASLLPRAQRGVHGLFRSAAALCLEACARCAVECDLGRSVAAQECAAACRSVVSALDSIVDHPQGAGPRWSVHPADAP